MLMLPYAPHEKALLPGGRRSPPRLRPQTACQYVPASPAPASRRPADFELDEVSLADLASGLQKGKWTSARLVQLYLARIDAIDRQWPPARLRAGPQPRCRRHRQPARPGTQKRPFARAAARHPDPAQRQHRNQRPHQHHRRFAGLADWRAPQDAFVAARLRAAGAIILGKTNLSEWANFRSTHSTSGWSGRGGQTKNPYALDRNPSGSSSGSGAAAASSLCAAAVGTRDRWIGHQPFVYQWHRWASSPLSDWSAARASFPFRSARTPPDRWRARFAMSPFCSASWPVLIPKTRPTAASQGKATDYTRSLDPKACAARASASRANFSKTTPRSTPS